MSALLWIGPSRRPFLLLMGLLPSLVGQPLVSPEAAFLWRGARLRQHPRRTAPADGQLRLPTAQASTDFAARLAVNRTTRTSSGPRREAFLCSQELFDAFSTSVRLSCHAAISSPVFCAKPIAAGSVCEDSEAVAAATRRIRAAFRRGARIAINSCAHGCSTTKAIKAAPPLSGRTGDGASRRDSRKSLPVVRYRNASWL